MSFIPKSIKGASILSNVLLEQQIELNTNLTAYTRSSFDIGSTSASFRNGYFDNLIVSGSSVGNYIRNQITSDAPINYNTTNGNLSLLYNTTQMNVSNSTLTLSEAYLRSLFTTTITQSSYAFHAQQFIYDSSGTLNINDNYTKNEFTGSGPITYTNGNIGINLSSQFSTSASGLSLNYSNPFTFSSGSLSIKLATTEDFNSNLLQKLFVNGNGELDVSVDNLIYAGQGLRKVAVLDEMLSLGLNTANIDIPEITVLAVNADPLIFNYSSFLTGNYLTMKNLGISRIPYYDVTGYTTNYNFTYTSETGILDVGNVSITPTTRLSNNNLAASVGYVNNLNFYLTDTPIYYTSDGDSRVWNIRYDNVTISTTATGQLQSTLSVLPDQPINLDPENQLSFGYNAEQFSVVSGLLKSTLLGLGAISLNPANEISVLVNPTYLLIEGTAITFSAEFLAKYDTLTTDVETLTTDVETIQGQIETITGDITALDGDITALNTTVSAIPGTISLAVGGLASSIALVTGGLALDLGGLHTYVTNFENRTIDSFNTDSGYITANTNSIVGINTSTNNILTSIGSLNTTITGLNTSTSNILTSIGSLNTTITATNTSVGNLTSNLTAINTSVGNLITGINTSLGNLNTGINISVGNLTSNLTAINATCSSLNTSVTNINATCSNILSTLTSNLTTYSSGSLISNSLQVFNSPNQVSIPGAYLQFNGGATQLINQSGSSPGTIQLCGADQLSYVIKPMYQFQPGNITSYSTANNIDLVSAGSLNFGYYTPRSTSGCLNINYYNTSDTLLMSVISANSGGTTRNAVILNTTLELTGNANISAGSSIATIGNLVSNNLTVTTITSLNICMLNNNLT